MKKIISLIAGIAILLTFTSSAFAGENSATISKTLTSTTEYYNALVKNGKSTSIEKSKSKSNWNAPFDGAADSQRVVVRIYQQGGNVVSSTWVYTGYSTTTHPYKASYVAQSISVFLGAKVDDRDEGPITISGKFNSSK